MSKIFGDYKNLEELNETARNLREAKEYDDLLVLGLENGVDEETVKRFYESGSEFLIQEQEPVPNNNSDKNIVQEQGEKVDIPEIGDVPKSEKKRK